MPSRSSRGWRSCTGACRTGRPWAAWCRNCARRCRKSEKQIDLYFRNPAQREVLIPVPGQLQAMRGVLSVLDMDQASQAVLRMSEDVDALAVADIDPQHAAASGTFNRLADNLGALSFMIDMLSVQPQMARSLFRYDPETGNLSAVMGRRSHRLSAFGGFDELKPSATAAGRPGPVAGAGRGAARRRRRDRAAGAEPSVAAGPAGRPAGPGRDHGLGAAGAAACHRRRTARESAQRTGAGGG